MIGVLPIFQSFSRMYSWMLGGNQFASVVDPATSKPQLGIRVPSYLKLDAQYFRYIPLSFITGEGESVLNVVNATGKTLTVDLSKIDLSGFRAVHIAANVTLVVDQEDIESVRIIGGEGVLRASSADGVLDLKGKLISVAVQDKDGAAFDAHGATVVDGSIIIGGSGPENLVGTSDDDRIEGGAGNDTLAGGEGDDVLRGGAGVDSMYGGGGNDRIVIVGDLSSGGKIDSIEDSSALGQDLSELNGIDLNEDADGGAEVISGGDGEDTLYVYGTADLSNADISGIEHIEIRSYVTFGKEFFDQIQAGGGVTVTGDGSSILEIVGGTAAEPLVIDLTASDGLDLSKIGHIILGPHVVLQVNTLEQLGGARTLTGTGSIVSTGAALQLSSTYVIADTLSFQNIATTSASIAHVVNGTYKDSNHDGIIDTIYGTDGNDFINGTAFNDTIDGRNGDDVLSGKDGDDSYVVHGTGKKTILDSAGSDTLDLSKAGSGATVDLTDGGFAGGSEIVLGNGSLFVSRQATDLFLLQDVSGSFSDDINRLKQIVNSPNGLVEQLLEFQPDTRFGLGIFDPPVGSHYQTLNALTDDVASFKQAVNQLRTYGDEELLVALQTVVARAETAEIGYGRQALRILLVSTDEPYAEDIKIDVAALSESLKSKNIYPVFLVTNNLVGYYENFVTQLGIGDVVGMNSDSSDIVAAITNAFANYKVDFIENLLGTEFADTLTGNSLDNTIKGNRGNDVLKGLGGDDVLYGGDDSDIAVFRGLKNEYSISSTDDGKGLIVHDTVAGRDGTDVVIDIETLQFADQNSGTSGCIEGDLIDSDTLFKEYGKGAPVASDPYLNPWLFFDLANAAYYHPEVLKSYTGMEDESGEFQNTSYDNIKKILCFLSSEDLGIDKWATADGDEGYAYADGFYVAYDKDGIDRSSVATVTRAEDALFLTFRGTVTSSDWYDNFFDMTGHYERFQPLFDAIDNYLLLNPEIQKVYVAGHSLGGNMAIRYLESHKNDAKYAGVTFEAANPLNADHDTRLINFEMRGDIVPDLGENYGNTIHMNFEGNLNSVISALIGVVQRSIGKTWEEFIDAFSDEFADWELMKSHVLESIYQGMDLVVDALGNISDIDRNELIYLDHEYDKGSDGVIITEPFVLPDYLKDLALLNALIIGTPMDPMLKIALSAIMSYLDGYIASNSDFTEYMNLEYDFLTSFDQYGGTLVLQDILGFDDVIKSTFTITDPKLSNVVLADGVGGLTSAPLSVNGSNADQDLILFGNSNNNRLTGGEGDDVLFAGADKDMLFGGKGDDILYAASYAMSKKDKNAKIAANEVEDRIDNKDVMDVIKEYQQEAMRIDKDDQSILYGGQGKDTMIGGGDNDYFFIDVDGSEKGENNVGNVDLIKGFHVSDEEIFVEDYLVFSALQLGLLDSSVYTSFNTDGAFNLGGPDVDIYVLNADQWWEIIGKEDYLITLGDIDDYTNDNYNTKNTAFSFVLDIQSDNTGDLYFDLYSDQQDYFKVATIQADDHGDRLEDMHADQIAIVGSFDEFNFA